jgi:hypothetical protein
VRDINRREQNDIGLNKSWENQREQRWREYPVIDQSRQVVATAFRIAD